jgi:predicted DNA-binding transcriptional regulator AlpA
MEAHIMPLRSPASEPSGVDLVATQKLTNYLLLTAADSAALCNVSLRTWWAWDAAGKIPRAIRIGHKVFWRPEELKAWVAAGCPERAMWEAMQS